MFSPIQDRIRAGLSFGRMARVVRGGRTQDFRITVELALVGQWGHCADERDRSMPGGQGSPALPASGDQSSI